MSAHDTSEQYKEAAKRADDLGNFGEEIIDLRSIRRASFIHGYAAALIDIKYGKDRRKLFGFPFAHVESDKP